MDIEEFKTTFGEVEIPEEALTAAYEKVSGVIKDAHRGTTNKTLSEVDATLSAMTGLKKEHGELTGDFVKRAFEAQNATLSEAGKAKEQELKQQIAAAKEQVGKEGSEELTKLQEELVKTREELASRETSFNEQLKMIERKSTIQNVVSGLTLNPNLPENILQPYMEQAKQKALEMNTVEIGGKTYASEDGNIPLVQADKNVTIEDYIKSLYQDILAPEAPKGNGSTTDAGQGSAEVAGTTQVEAYANKEKELKAQKLSPDEVRAKLHQFVKSEAYNKLPPVM